MTLEIKPFRENTSNWDILNAIRKNATLDYQKRIPAATQATMQDSIHNLLTYRPQMNEFIDALVNRIGLEIVRGILWTNPLAKFKRGMLEYGDTIEEIIVGLLKAKKYDNDRDYLERDIFGQETPDVQSSFHKVNRTDYYKITIKEAILKRAFLTDNGISEFITKLMSAPTTSDNWDEFLLTTSLFGEYYRSGGFFKVNVPDVSSAASTGNDARYTLRRLREFSDTLPYISTHYNASGMPVAAMPDELELFITPEANAALDVEALAGAFNIDKAQFASRTTVIPREHFGIDGAQAILSTRDFFVIADQRIDTTNAVNPVGLITNYFLHHWQVISASRFVPALLFTTEDGDVINIVDEPVTDVSTPVVSDMDGATVTEVERGSLYTVAAVTDVDGGAVRYDLVGELSARTYLTQTGVLHVASDEDSVSLVINVVSVEDNTITDTLTIPVVGDKLELWPNPEVLPDSDTDGVFEVTPEELVMVDDQVTIPTVKGVQYLKDGVNVNNGSVHTIAGTVAFTAVARSGYELATGATAAWSFTV